MPNAESTMTAPNRPTDTPDHGISSGEAARVWARVAALNYGTLLPGPEAQQLAIYIGWLLHKTRGGLVAGILFVLPGAITIMALSWIYAIFGNIGAVQALFFGLKAAVLAIVLEAVLRIGRRALRNNVMVGLAAAAFIALFFFKAPFPLVILAAGVIGFLGGRAGWASFVSGNG